MNQLARMPHPCGASLVAQWVKNPSAVQETQEITGSIPGSRRSAEGGNGNPLQYFHLENPPDRGVHGVAKELATT